MIRNWYIRENVKYVSLLIVLSLVYSLVFPPFVQANAAKRAHRYSMLQMAYGGNSQKELSSNTLQQQEPSRPILVAQHEDIKKLALLSDTEIVVSEDTFSASNTATGKKKKRISRNTRKGIFGFQAIPEKRTLSAKKEKNKISHTFKTESPFIGFSVNPRKRHIVVQHQKRYAGKDRQVKKANASSTAQCVIENQCDPSGGAQMLASCSEDNESDCDDHAELWMAEYEYEFQDNNILEIRASYKNISEKKTLHQPFCFTVNEDETTCSKIEQITLPTSDALSQSFYDDDILSPGETTTTIIYRVKHKGKRFTFYVDAYAVVEEDATCTVENQCEPSELAQMLEPCTENEESGCGEDTELWMSEYTYEYQSDNILEIQAKFKNITETTLFQQPFCFFINEEETTCSAIKNITLPDAESLANAFGDDNILSPGEETATLTFKVKNKGDSFSFYVDAYAVIGEIAEPTPTPVPSPTHTRIPTPSPDPTEEHWPTPTPFSTSTPIVIPSPSPVIIQTPSPILTPSPAVIPTSSVPPEPTPTAINPAPTVTISASVEFITKGNSTTLSWNATNANSCYIEPDIGAVGLNGSTDVSPQMTTTYIITAFGTDGNASDKAMIKVEGVVEPQPEGSFGEQYEDLIPSDATVESYDDYRFSVITGLVEDIGRNPLSGITVCIFDNLQYGTAVTDDNGRFSLPIEGGTTFTLEYPSAAFGRNQKGDF